MRFSTPVQPGPGVHSANWVSSPAVKETGRVVNQPPHLKPELSYTPSCLCAFMVCYRTNFLKLVRLPPVKTWGRGDIAPLILNFGSKCRYGVSFTFGPLYHYKTAPLYTMNSRQGGSQKRPGRFEEEQNLFPASGIEPLFVAYPAPSLDAILAELYRLHYANNVLRFIV